MKRSSCLKDMRSRLPMNVLLMDVNVFLRQSTPLHKIMEINVIQLCCFFNVFVFLGSVLSKKGNIVGVFHFKASISEERGGSGQNDFPF